MRLRDAIQSLDILQGPRAGQPFRLLPWQAGIVEAVEDPSIQRIGFSVPRGNGKSTLAAAIAVGQWLASEPLEDIVIVASSLAQGVSAIGRHIRGWIPSLEGVPYTRTDSVNRFEYRRKDNGSRILILGSDPRRAHGLSPKLTMLDEVVQYVPAHSRRMFEALATAAGKVENSTLLAFSTRSGEPAHWFETLLKAENPADYSVVYSADREDNPLDKETWRKANPSWNYFPVLRKAVENDAQAAAKDREELLAFRSYRLNEALDAGTRTIVQLADWARLTHSAERAGTAYLGMDLGGARSLTAAAAYWPDTGRLEVFAGVPSGGMSLSRRERRDGVPYRQLVEDGEIWPFDSRVTPVRGFLRRLASVLAGVEVAHVGADDYRAADLLDALDAEVPDWPVAEIKRGKGSRPGGFRDVRSFRREVLNRKLSVPRGRKLIEHAIASSMMRRDAAGNSVLDKRQANGRIDALSAAIIAVGAAKADVASQQQFTFAVLPASDAPIW